MVDMDTARAQTINKREAKRYLLQKSVLLAAKYINAEKATCPDGNVLLDPSICLVMLTSHSCAFVISKASRG
tara:strand:- start:3021 stop:3236 length:216 start_codon:yes stop_codon:yes gene_type:complete